MIEGVIEGERERERWKSGIVMMIRSTIQRDIRRVLLPKYFNGNNSSERYYGRTHHLD